jgi:8-oxo-dGTP pyrophosphatase MutT (NUDIX family)
LLLCATIDPVPQPAAIVLVPTHRPNRWLVVRRPEPPHEWALPGGHIEPGETPARAGIREVAEETGVYVDPSTVMMLGTTQHNGRTVYVLLAQEWSGPARAAEGWPVGWAQWRQLRAQASRFGTQLDRIAMTLRSRGVPVG